MEEKEEEAGQELRAVGEMLASRQLVPTGLRKRPISWHQAGDPVRAKLQNQ